MSRGRVNKSIHFVVANEAWQIWFAGEEGEEQLR